MTFGVKIISFFTPNSKKIKFGVKFMGFFTPFLFLYLFEYGFGGKAAAGKRWLGGDRKWAHTLCHWS